MIDYIGGKGMRYEGCLKKRFSMGKKLLTLQKMAYHFWPHLATTGTPNILNYIPRPVGIHWANLWKPLGTLEKPQKPGENA